jgi:hypothetical protein
LEGIRLLATLAPGNQTRFLPLDRSFPTVFNVAPSSRFTLIRLQMFVARRATVESMHIGAALAAMTAFVQIAIPDAVWDDAAHAAQERSNPSLHWLGSRTGVMAGTAAGRPFRMLHGMSLDVRRAG